MALLESIYGVLPPALQNLACSLEGIRIARDRFNHDFDRKLLEYEGRTRWGWNDLRAYRDSRLAHFIRTYVRGNPTYSGIKKENLVSLRAIEDLHTWPILSKEDIKGRSASSLGSQIAEKTQAVHTSGTTGSGFHFIATESGIREQWAVWWRYRKWHGIDLNTWCAYFGGRTIISPTTKCAPFWRINYPGRQIMFSAYHLSRETAKSYAGCLRLKRPPWIHGYPSTISLLANFIIESGFDLGYQPRFITTGAENLFRQQRRVIERAFGAPVRQHYGSAEAVANFSECENGALHVDEDFAAVEFIPIQGTGLYRVVGTNFTNPATPLVRYDSGDRVTLGGECECGRSGRVVREIDGRREDYVILADGTMVGRLDHIFKDLDNVRQAQIYQRKPGEFTYLIVRGSHYTRRDEQALLAETRERLGKDIRVRVEYVDGIQRTSGGKLRFVVSEVKEASIESGTLV